MRPGELPLHEDSPGSDRPQKPTVSGSIDPGMAHRARLMQAGQMLAGVVHEINNPLAVIQGYAQLLHDRLADEEDRRDLACILDEARRLGTLVEDMLSFTRRGADTVEVVDLNHVIGSAVNLTTHSMRQARITLVAAMPQDPTLVRGNQGCFVQVVLNLLSNALQSLESGRPQTRGISVRVEAQPNGRTALLVANNGPPIPEDQHEAIFEPFYTTKSDGEGSGLGLALCRDILRRYDATIGLVPSEGDEGVVFRLEMQSAT
jgi:two-component system NtrC family sensor kinase